MHFIDILALAALAIFTGFGIKRGFVGEIFRLAAVILGFISAALFYTILFEYLSFISIPDTAKTALSFLLVYLATALGVLCIGWMVRKIIHLTLLGWLDRLLGATIGMAKAVLLIWLMILCVQIAPSTAMHDTVSQSITYRILTSLPFRLNSPAPSLPQFQNIIDTEKPWDKIIETREKIGTFKQKVDSAKTRADSLSSKVKPGAI